MTGIASTTANLALWRLQWETLFSLPHLLDESEMDDEEGCRLTEIENFGDNPGNLRLFQYVPRDLPPQAPLVVVLHGCTQTAPVYDRSSGWSRLAEARGFALLFAQQRSENNPRRCFNWFRPNDITRDSGEAASIRHMVGYMTETHDLDRRRVFVNGLSAGGGMTNVMLATYPDVFAAGAIIAGLPYRSATTVHDALRVMMDGAVRSPEAWGDEVREASPLGRLADSRIDVPWPRVAVWQGLGDDVVAPGNAVEIVKQWTNVHGLPEDGGKEDQIGGNKRLRWLDAAGNVAVEAIAIDHLGHAVPIDGAQSVTQEQPGPHFADIGLSSTVEIARFFGLLADEPAPEPDLETLPEASEDQADAPAVALSRALNALPLVSRGRRGGARGRVREPQGRVRAHPPGMPPPAGDEAPPPVAAPDERAPPATQPLGLVALPSAGNDVSAGERGEAAAGKRAAAEVVPDAAARPPAPETSAPDAAADAAAAAEQAREGILSRFVRLLGLSGRN